MRRVVFLGALAFGLGGCNLLFGLGEAVEREGAGGAGSSSSSVSSSDSASSAESSSSSSNASSSSSSSSSASSTSSGGGSSQGGAGGTGEGGSATPIDCGGDDPVKGQLLIEGNWSTFADLGANAWEETAGGFDFSTTTDDSTWARGEALTEGGTIDLRLLETWPLAAGDVIEVETRWFFSAGGSLTGTRLGVYTDSNFNVAIAEIDDAPPEGLLSAQSAFAVGEVTTAVPAARLRVSAVGTDGTLLYLDYINVTRWSCPD